MSKFFNSKHTMLFITEIYRDRERIRAILVEIDEYTWTYKSEMAKTDIVMQYKDSFLAIFDLLIRREVWGRKIKKRKGIMNEIDDWREIKENGWKKKME